MPVLDEKCVRLVRNSPQGRAGSQDPAVDKTVSFEQVKQIAERTERKLLQDINVFDVYEGDKIEAGKKAIAISFTLLDKQQTLTDKTIESTMSRLMQQFEKQLGAVIRK